MEEKKARLSYSIDEFCQATGMSRTSVYAAIGDGSLASIKHGKRRLITANAAQAFLARLEAASKVKA